MHSHCLQSSSVAEKKEKYVAAANDDDDGDDDKGAKTSQRLIADADLDLVVGK